MKERGVAPLHQAGLRTYEWINQGLGLSSVSPSRHATVANEADMTRLPLRGQCWICRAHQLPDYLSEL